MCIHRTYRQLCAYLYIPLLEELWAAVGTAWGAMGGNEPCSRGHDFCFCSYIKKNSGNFFKSLESVY